MVTRGLAETRTQAQAIILAGQVFSAEKRLEKPGQLVSAEDLLAERRGGAQAGIVDHVAGLRRIPPDVGADDAPARRRAAERQALAALRA